MHKKDALRSGSSRLQMGTVGSLCGRLSAVCRARRFCRKLIYAPPTCALSFFLPGPAHPKINPPLSPFALVDSLIVERELRTAEYSQLLFSDLQKTELSQPRRLPSLTSIPSNKTRSHSHQKQRDMLFSHQHRKVRGATESRLTRLQTWPWQL